MRSLTLKLTLAFLIVGLIGALLVAFFVGQRTGREFDQFLALQERARLISELQDVYTATGDWTGLEERLGGQLSRDAARMMIMGTLLDSEGRYLAGRPPRADDGRPPALIWPSRSLSTARSSAICSSTRRIPTAPTRPRKRCSATTCVAPSC